LTSFNASRLTCFALLAGLESDARDAVLRLDENTEAVAWPSVAEQNARARFARDNGGAEPSRPDLVVYLDFPDSSQILLKNKVRAAQDLGQSTLDAISANAEALIAIRNRVAHNRPLEVEDLPTLADMCGLLNKQNSQAWPVLSSTLAQLARDPSYVLGLTIKLRTDPVDEPFHNLPVPDFDETGFMGRSNAVGQIKRAILGPWPAISILGDGGIGKTSIALKVAYDILDDHKDEFEAIVWVTAKSSTLSSHEVERINGAILDSMGLFAEAARHLGGAIASEDPVAELLAYLETFKVLLILDNMETVMDQRLRDFLRDLPRGSKVLITSRIGFQMENPVMLDPLTEQESKQLLMALAHRRNVKVIKELDSDGISKLVGKLRGHPLYIKWLIACVQAGRRPSEVVSNNEALLDFCMSDVFDKLTAATRQVLQSMQVMRGSRMQAELAYLNNFNAHQIQSALLELLATNFVSMTRSASDQLENSYVVGDFASIYLARKKPTEAAFRNLVLQRAQKLGELGTRMTGESRLNPFDPWTLDIRGPQDVPVAKILRDAHKATESGSYDLALELCHEAQILAPSYHETWRTEGLVQTRRRDHASAEQAFERSVELVEEGASAAIVMFHYAVYLADETGQFARALDLLQRAAKKDTSAEILVEIASCHFHLTSYAQALDSCRAVVEKAPTAAVLWTTTMLALRAISFGLIRDNYNGNVANGLELAEQATEFVYAVSIEVFDSELADWLAAVAHWARMLGEGVRSDDYLSRRSDEYSAQLDQRLRILDSALLERHIAPVKDPLPDGEFVFLNDGVDTFAHRNEFFPRNSWPRVMPHSVVAYDRVNGNRGPRAQRIRLLD